jgi:hypothetical protein
VKQAAFVRDSQSMAFELIRTGVNTVAAAPGVDTVVCKAFLEEMYGAMLPGRRAKEITIADAIRRVDRQSFGKSCKRE